MYECLLSNDAIQNNITENNKAKLKYRLYINGLISQYDFHYNDTVDEEINFDANEFIALREFII